MSIFSHKGRILITCPKRLPPFVKTELLTLGFPIKAERVAGVETEGTLGETMRLNLYLRTGHRVLFRLAEFTARNPEELYTKLSKIAWEEYISAESYLSVLSAVDTPTITDSRFANVKCKDAIVGRLRKNMADAQTLVHCVAEWSYFSTGKINTVVSILIPQENLLPNVVTAGFLSKLPCRKP